MYNFDKTWPVHTQFIRFNPFRGYIMCNGCYNIAVLLQVLALNINILNRLAILLTNKKLSFMKNVKTAIAKWLMMSVIILGVSCRKDHGEQPPPPVKEYDVITTGVILNPTGNVYDPYYWINDQRVPLEKDGSYEAFPYGIEKVGNDLYVAGGYTHTAVLEPCYWKNGIKKDLPIDGLNIELRCGAHDIKWFNNALYILGDVDLRPVIWKVKGNDITIIPIKPAGNVSDVQAAMNLEVYNNKLYFATAQKVTNGTTTFREAGYWVMDDADKVTYHALESNLLQALCYSLAISGKGIFVAGEYRDNISTPYPLPTVWSLQGRLPVVNQVNPNSQRINEVVLDGSGKIYLNVLDYSSTKPMVWKITGNTYDPLSPTIPATAKGYVQNLAMRDDKLAYGYTYIIDNKFYAGYSFNGTQAELKIPTHDFLMIHRTSIFPK